MEQVLLGLDRPQEHDHVRGQEERGDDGAPEHQPGRPDRRPHPPQGLPEALTRAGLPRGGVAQAATFGEIGIRGGGGPLGCGGNRRRPSPEARTAPASPTNPANPANPANPTSPIKTASPTNPTSPTGHIGRRGRGHGGAGHPRREHGPDPAAQEAGTRTAGSGLVAGVPAHPAQEHADHEEQEDHVEHGHRGRLTDVEPVGEGDLVHERDRGVGLVAGQLPGDDPDDRERVEHVDHVQHGRGQQGRPQQRERHLAVGLPGPGPVDLGRLVHVGGDGLQPGQHDERAERDGHHDPDHDQGPEVGRVVLVPLDRGVDDPQVQQDPVEHAVGALVDVAPHGRGHDQGRGPRHDQGPAHDPPAGEPLVQELGQRERDADRDRDDQHHPDHGVEQHVAQGGLMEQRLEVAESGRALGRTRSS